ncbi:MAG: ATP-binding protein [Candidatus Binatia bacterium]
MAEEQIAAAGRRHVSEVQASNRRLIEKALYMRGVSYYAQVKARLLTQTIIEVDRGRKSLQSRNAELTRRQETIAEQRQALAAWAAELERRVAERTVALERAVEASREASRLKSIFVATMSHEFRTPLSGIIGFAELIAQQTTDERLRDYARRIQRAGNRLNATLGDVLDLSVLESEAYRMRLEPVDIAEQCAAVVDALQTAARAKGIVLGFARSSAAPAVVRADPEVFGKVVAKLVGNAIKFTETGEVRVEVSGAPPEDAYVVSVTDTGVGIALDYLPHVFDEFRQESGGESRAFEGAGLGLALAKRFASLLGAVLSVESDKGVGTTVRLRLAADGKEPSEAGS